MKRARRSNAFRRSTNSRPPQVLLASVGAKRSSKGMLKEFVTRNLQS